jgi:hypothetical protein
VACLEIGFSNGRFVNMLFMDLKSASGEFQSLSHYLDLQH